ncbi:dienelactone hydrolase family protein [Mycobacteroides abscessus]|uniref:dienelactone hydrolase family protein n=1 Tax=Mycobacteroides abscessus TaxID=36809 RepID=UPI000C258D1D|nr:dienelactone hydrolase family protein [Mycobacteroides abscessus]
MDVTITSRAGDLAGYLAPALGEGNRPGIVVLHDITGTNDDTKGYADRFSTAGYTALAPDLYSRGGRSFRCIRSMYRQLEAGRGEAFEDIEASRQLLMNRADSSGTVGIVGFCMGGGFALLAATAGFQASAPYYPSVKTDRYDALHGACPIVASFGSEDVFLEKESARRLELKLNTEDVISDVKEYPGVGHSFANRPSSIAYAVVAGLMRSRYNHDASEDAWRRVLAFFDRHLRA